ncbi:MAG: ribonuclease J [Armatimonadetes bacterium]|nr:ribonuclease J [Candidatus Hippobium faecium]
MNKLKIIPLGGVMEIGKSLWCYEYNDDIIVVDCGLMFPNEDMPGVDIVIPDMTYLKENKDRIRGVFLTHGHEDHIGAIPYLLKNMSVPIYGTALTLGFVSNKLDEHNLLNTADLYEVSAGDILEAGAFEIEYFQVAHSIPDTCALVIRTPLGTIFHTSDFKFDEEAVNGYTIDFDRLKEISKENIIALMCDTTNVEKPGKTKSEKIVGETLERIIREAPGRVLIATFASNIHRVQQVVDICEKLGKKIGVFGRSMMSNCRIAEVLGYLKFPYDIKIDESEIDDYPEDKIVIMTTGSQGEPLSALSRIAAEEHKFIDIVPGDTVVISATPIPGNESYIIKTINRLFRLGAEVIYTPLDEVHVSGHANQEDIKTIISILKPKKYFAVHGEWRHYKYFRKFLGEMGVPSDDVIGLTLGDVYEFSDMYEDGISDKVKAGSVLVDGIGVGDVEGGVLRDRIHLAEDGVLLATITVDLASKEIINNCEIIARGVIRGELYDKLFNPLAEKIDNAVEDFFIGKDSDNIDALKSLVKKTSSKYIYEKTRRRPVVMPVVIEV